MMKKRADTAVKGRAGLAAALLMVFACAVPASAQQIDQAIFAKTPLILFAKSRSVALLDFQQGVIRDRQSEFEERGMVVITVAGTQSPIAAVGYVALSRGDNRKLRQRFDTEKTTFTAVLVGKDGEEIARWENPVDPDAVFQALDGAGTEGANGRGGS